ncbi:MAG TPA: translation initiation factor IF-2 [Polyangiales bacterium]
MIKVRVYEVARELGLDNRELVSKIASLGIQVRNHMSALEPAEVDRIKRALDKDRQSNVVEERIRPTVVRRRSVVSPGSGRTSQDEREERDDIAGTAAYHPPHAEPSPEPIRAQPVAARREERRDERHEDRYEEASADEAERPSLPPEPASRPAAVPPAPAPVAAAPEPRPAPVHTPPQVPTVPVTREAAPSAAPVVSPPPAAPSPESPEVRPAAVSATTNQDAPAARPEPKPAPPAFERPAAPQQFERAPQRDFERPQQQGNFSNAQSMGTRGVQPPFQRRGDAPQTMVDVRRPSALPPASERLGHTHLPPGVVARGNTVAPSAPRLSSEAVSRIVAQHNPIGGQQGAGAAIPPRRRELGRAALGTPGRQQARPGRPGAPGRARKLMPGRKGLSTQITTPGAQKRIIRIEDQVNLQQLAQRMSLKATEVLMKLVQLGMTGVNINSKLDADTAKILANEFGYEVENVAVSAADMIAAARGTITDEQTDYVHRAPIVTVMGHVDHGKTSLLDKIRSTRVAAREAGGITQHIGAYRVDTEHGTIVFLDTPGHEAFTAMRARGAEATDVVILVVAADDGVMPQTREAIAHAKAANVPIIVAVNKIDKEGARPDVVMRDLAGEGLQSEEWGGETLFQNVSAVTGEGVSELLEKVLLQSEMLELNANPKVPAEGVVLEAYLDKGRGPVANVLVRNGTLKIGDLVVAGQAWGKVKAMTDDRGRQLREAEPATPIEILGLSEVPSAGESFYVVTDIKKAQEIAETKRRADSNAMPTQQRMGLDQFHAMMKEGDVHELKLIIKADVQGSIEALVKALTDLSTDKVRVNVIHTGVGGITENDVLLATASNCIVIGFNVRPAGKAADVAKSERVDLRLYRVIYDAVEEVKKAMAGMLAPNMVEKALGKAEVRQVFTIPKIGSVAGCYVIDGVIKRSGKARVVRDNIQVWQGSIKGLRRIKDDVREVAYGYECGISLDGFNDIKERDVIECFELESVAAQL